MAMFNNFLQAQGKNTVCNVKKYTELSTKKYTSKAVTNSVLVS